MKTKISLLILLFSVSTFYSAFAQLTILSGPEQLTYYRFVEDMNSVLGNDSVQPFINKSTNGAGYNFEQLADPHSPYKIALIQEDVLYYMSALDHRDNTKKTKDLKVIFPLAQEQIQVVIRKNSGINKLQDLNEKMVAIGTTDQGTYMTANYIKIRSKVYWRSRNIHIDDALNELYMDRIDAFIIIGSAPISIINIDPRAMVKGLDLVELDNFNGWADYYDNDTIYSGTYKWLEKDVPTFSVQTVMVVNTAKLTDEDKAELNKFITELKAKLDTLKEVGHPQWKEVDLNNWSPDDWPVYK
jgi:TRAP transporter TAXI family solute receptor